MRFLLRVLPSGGDAGRTDATLRSIARSVGGKAANTKVTSYGAVELDVFLPTRPDFDLFLAVAEPLAKIEFFRDLQEPAPFSTTAGAVAEAVRLFNAERFWEVHEVLEGVWRHETGEEKKLLQGMILVCAALVHVQKAEPEVALGVARRSLSLLSWPHPKYHNVDVRDLKGKVETAISAGRLSAFRI